MGERGDCSEDGTPEARRGGGPGTEERVFRSGGRRNTSSYVGGEERDAEADVGLKTGS